ncbi:MAG TPA: plastocyanin/azurin family copper-binding protein [Nitrososphaera sp.]|nr:plastocyanin/azurin family copper-binding protein [Nitrososphaera sp.]
MSHEDHGHDKDPIILTSGRRMGKGLIIVIATLAVGAGIIVPFFDQMYSTPPPVTQIRTERPPPETPPEAGTTTIAILQGAATQGSPDYDPDEATVPLGNRIVWDNQDTVPHTATSGADGSDPAMGDLFDTGIINGGEQSDPVETEGMAEGDVIEYFCTLHPYMTSVLTITAAEEGAAAGPTINILQGSSAQGSDDYDPDQMTAKVGDEVSVVNQDTVPHSVTSGTGPSDANRGAAFDTNIINGGESATISLAEVDAGEYGYFCIVHPYMTGTITVE